VSVAGVVLAAGFSRRLGRPKQTVEMQGETLVARAVRVAREAGLAPVLLVVQPGAAFARESNGLGCEVVQNAAAEEGIASSIRAGVGALVNVDAVTGVVLMTCDQVGTTAQHLRALCREPEQVTGSGYAGNVAVPAYFPRSRFEDLRALQGDSGARGLLKEARSVQCEELALDVDTEADLVRALRWRSEAP
jgi:molybdenum cofactor cytidylyltransferase